MRSIIFIALFLITNQVPALTAEDLVKELHKILATCKKEGFYQCQDKYFQGNTRGIFHLPIEKQKLRITENKYKEFINAHQKEGVNVNLKKSINVKFNLTDDFDISRFSSNYISSPIKPLNPDGTLFKFSFKKAPPLVLVKIDNSYKIGVLPEDENNFRETNDFKTAYIYKLKNNILQYHMKEAEMLNYDASILDRKVSEAQAPIALSLGKGKVPDYVNDYLTDKTMKDIQRFYMPLNNKKSIKNKIKQLHNL
jgi:hypothetical protein